MNFNEWSNSETMSMTLNEIFSFKSEQEIAWEACKNEVLNTIKNVDVSQRSAYLVLIELKEKIEKL